MMMSLIQLLLVVDRRLSLRALNIESVHRDGISNYEANDDSVYYLLKMGSIEWLGRVLMKGTSPDVYVPFLSHFLDE